MTKKLLITGFDPFGGERINPAWEAVKSLPDKIGEVELTKLQIPTIFEAAARTVLEAAEKFMPDVILCIGQAGGRKAITPELVGINLREASIPDNAGNKPVDTPVVEGGPVAYFSTVPVRKMVAAINETGVSGVLSSTAGTFVCNDVLYTLLDRYDGRDTQVGFIHVPFLPEQAKENVPSMPLEDIVRGLEAAISVL